MNHPVQSSVRPKTQARRCRAWLLLVALGASMGVAPAARAACEATAPADLPMTAAESRNLAQVKTWWRRVVESGHLEYVPQYQAEGYIQHNPNISTGRAAFLDAFRGGEVLDPIPAQLTEPVPLAGARGDFVWIMREKTAPGAQHAGETVHTYGFDLLRLEGGLIQEHWDVARKAAGSGAVRFGHSVHDLREYPAGRLTRDERAAERAAITAVTAVYVRHEAARLQDLFEAGYREHDPNLCAPGSLTALLAQSGPGEALTRESPSLSLVNGPYVLMMWEAASADPDDAGQRYPWFYFHLVRMSAGKVAEHWDTDRSH